MRKDFRLNLLKQAWEFSFSHDKQIAIGVEKMYYKRYFKDEVDTLEEDVIRLQKMMVTLSNDLYHRGLVE